MQRLLGVCALLCVLSSCRSALYRAAEQGDVERVRTELAAGATVDGEPRVANALWQYPAKLLAGAADAVMGICTLGVYDEPRMWKGVDAFDKSAVDVAWERGHMAVLDVLAEAGAVVAPESLREGVLLLQEDWYGSEGHAEDASVVAEVCNENVADCFVRYWAEDDDWRQRRGVVLKHCVWRGAAKGQVLCHQPRKKSTPDMLETPDVLCYRRTGVRSAEVTERVLVPALAGHKYELSFDTPQSGTYRHLYADAQGVVRSFKGRFWLRTLN